MSPGRRTAIALCDGLEASAELADSLGRALPNVRVAVVPGLSQAAERGPAFAARAGVERLVLGVGADGASAGEVQREARRAGLDPFAVEQVRIPAGVAGSGSAALRLRAAAAGLRASPESAPEQLRPRLVPEAAAVSRRALLTLPPLTYEPVAGVVDDRCAEPERCGLCIDACPAGALAVDAGRIAVHPERCDGCGRCVSSCPKGALGIPGSSLDRYEAELAALLAEEQPALVFCCRRAGAELDAAAAGWLPVEVPSVAAATPGWGLQALAGGAVAVGFCSCEDEGHCAEAVIEARAAYVRELLRLLGDERAAERVQTARVGRDPLPQAPSLTPLRSRSPDRPLRLSEPDATAGALLALSGAGGSASLAHEASPLGVIALRGQACTLCGACAGVCPTAALCLEGGETLSWDAARCVACGRCALVCPERAIAVERATEADALAEGRAVLVSGSLVRCRSCGAAIAPRPLLDRIRTLLADDGQAEPLFRILGERCGDCRGSALAPLRLAKGEQWT